jgi:hypothetical protein
LRAQLNKLLVVPEGQRCSELDLLRRPPFTLTITGLVRALDRIRGIGAGELDLSGVPPARIVALARYADQAWATQLADLAPQRRIATLTACTHVLAAPAEARQLVPPRAVVVAGSLGFIGKPVSTLHDGLDDARVAEGGPEPCHRDLDGMLVAAFAWRDLQ